MNIYKFSNNKLFYKFWAYYVALIIIPIILLGCINYFISVHTIEEKNKSFYNNLVLKTKATIESKINYIDNLSALLLRNKRLQKVLYDYDKSTLDELMGDMDSFYAISELKRIIFINENIKEASLYVKNINCIINAYGMEDSDYYFKNIYDEIITGFDNFIKSLTKLNNMYYSPPGILHLNNRDSKVFTFARTSPDNQSGINGAILLYVDNSILSNILPAYSTYGKLFSFIIDSNGNVIAGDISRHEFNTDYSFYSENYINIKHKNKSYNVFSSSIGNIPWKLVIYTPSDSQTFLIDYSKTFLNIIFVFIAIGLLCSMLIALKNYKPINRIVFTLKNHSTEDYTVLNKDEYSFIEYKFQQINSKIVELGIAENAYKKAVCDFLTIKMLYPSNYKDTDYNALTDAQLIFQKGAYLIVALDIVYDVINDDLTVAAQKKYNRLLYKLISCKTKLESIKILHTKDFNGKGIILFSWSISEKSSDTAAVNYESLTNILIDAKGILEAKRNIIISIGIGTIETSVEDITHSYSHAVEALSYKVVKGIGRVISYTDIKATRKQSFYYPIDVEVNLLKMLKACDITGIKSILNTVVEENLIDRKLDLYHGNCLYYELYATLIKGLKSCGLELKHVSNAALNRACSIKDLTSLMQSYFENACMESLNTAGNSIINKVIKYLNDNYTDPKLSLNYVANELNISPFSISKLFSGNMDNGFQDYINRKRINHAIKLLMDSDYSISKICELSGFSNTHTFIRVFKRYEGVTPGQYWK